jgi:hypothetical protein
MKTLTWLSLHTDPVLFSAMVPFIAVAAIAFGSW